MSIKSSKTIHRVMPCYGGSGLLLCRLEEAGGAVRWAHFLPYVSSRAL